MSIGEGEATDDEDYAYFVHGTTTELWRGGPIDPLLGGGDFGVGFYTFADTRWGREAASNWAARKVRRSGEPIVIRVRIARAIIAMLSQTSVADEQFGAMLQRYARYGETGSAIVTGPIGRRNAEGIRVPDRSLPQQVKFEGIGAASLAIIETLPVSRATMRKGMSGQAVTKNDYLAVWRALFRELLGWSDAETLAWVSRWIDSVGHDFLDDPDDIFYHETPQYWAVGALLPSGLDEQIGHSNWLTVQQRIKHLFATGESRDSPLTADWRPYRVKIERLLADYGASLPVTATR